jgi:pimeloyl-ACP methyl ester carboxylesterase
MAAVDWLPVANGLETRAWFALDLPGHGESAHAPAYSHLSDSEVLAGFLAQISGPATVVGHSRGGQIAGLAAARRPALFRGLFLEDVTPLFFEEGATRDLPFLRSVFAVSRLVARLQRESNPVDWLATQISALPHDDSATIGQRLPPSAIATWASSASVIDNDMFGAKATFGSGGLSAADQMRQIVCPLHLAHGDAGFGSFVTAAEVEWFLGGPRDATATFYPSTGHVIHAWRTPEFINDLKAFLARVG